MTWQTALLILVAGVLVWYLGSAILFGYLLLRPTSRSTGLSKLLRRMFPGAAAKVDKSWSTGNQHQFASDMRRAEQSLSRVAHLMKHLLIAILMVAAVVFLAWRLL